MRAILFFLSLLLFSCHKQESREFEVDQKEEKPNTQEKRVKVQHLLIGFEASIAGKKIERSKAEAKELARELFEKAKGKSSDYFYQLIREHSDDQVPGIYDLSNSGVKPKKNEFPRNAMVKAFGDKAFSLQPGEFGFVAYDKENSPYGYHILYRIN